jgi:hypothetical protein
MKQEKVFGELWQSAVPWKPAVKSASFLQCQYCGPFITNTGFLRRVSDANTSALDHSAALFRHFWRIMAAIRNTGNK